MYTDIDKTNRVWTLPGGRTGHLTKQELHKPTQWGSVTQEVTGLLHIPRCNLLNFSQEVLTELSSKGKLGGHTRSSKCFAKTIGHYLQ